MNHRALFSLVLAAAIAFGLMAGVPAPQDPVAKQLATERLETAQKVFEHLQRWPETSDDVEVHARWSHRIYEAAIDAGVATKAKARAEHVERLDKLLQVHKALHEAGRRSIVDVQALKFHIAAAKGLPQ